ncbi:DUF1963 domain-containing protein [Stackebrandtia soli]|uniref:DUF1963 domain-containing protein n=1 Tax=Stackebrandtia soli TaxID=1892856 RepID=UPI0039EAA90C
MTRQRNDLLSTFVGLATRYIAFVGTESVPDNDFRLLGMVRDAVAPDLGDAADAAVAAIRPAIDLVFDESAPATGTRWGGLPTLPPDVEWPRHDGLPMSLIVTVDCVEMARLLRDDWPYPRTGELLFFHCDYATADYSYEDSRVGRIVHVPGTDSRREPPVEFRDYGVYPEVAYRVNRRLMFPHYMAYDEVGADLLAMMSAAERAPGILGTGSWDYLLGHSDGSCGDLRPLLHVEAGPGTHWGEQVAISIWTDVEAFAEGRLGEVHVACEIA